MGGISWDWLAWGAGCLVVLILLGVAQAWMEARIATRPIRRMAKRLEKLFRLSLKVFGESQIQLLECYKEMWMLMAQRHRESLVTQEWMNAWANNQDFMEDFSASYRTIMSLFPAFRTQFDNLLRNTTPWLEVTRGDLERMEEYNLSPCLRDLVALQAALQGAIADMIQPVTASNPFVLAQDKRKFRSFKLEFKGHIRELQRLGKLLRQIVDSIPKQRTTESSASP